MNVSPLRVFNHRLRPLPAKLEEVKEACEQQVNEVRLQLSDAQAQVEKARRDAAAAEEESREARAEAERFHNDRKARRETRK